MGMNAYGASLTTLAGVDAFRKVKPTRNARIITILVLTVIWFVIGKLITTSAVGVVDTALTLMLYLLVPWTVTNLIDFFFVRRGHYAILDIFEPNGIYGVWSYRGLIAYAAGFAAEIPFMVLLNLVSLKSYYTGPLASDLNSVDISWIVGAVVTAVVYWLLTRNLNVRRRADGDRGERRRPAADRGGRRELTGGRARADWDGASSARRLGSHPGGSDRDVAGGVRQQHRRCEHGEDQSDVRVRTPLDPLNRSINDPATWSVSIVSDAGRRKLDCGNYVGGQAPPASFQVVLGVVALPAGPRYAALQTSLSGYGNGALRLFAKTGLVIKPGTTFELIVPARFSARLGIGWGSPGTPSRRVVVSDCPSAGGGWLGFAGGVLDRSPGLRADHRQGRQQTATGQHRRGKGVPWPATAAGTEPELAVTWTEAVSGGTR